MAANARARAECFNTDLGVAPKAAKQAQRMQYALLNNALERRSSYFVDLVSLSGTSGRTDVGSLVTELQTLTRQEREVQAGLAKLCLVQEMPRLQLMPKHRLAAKQQSLEDRLSVLRASSAAVCDDLRSSIALS